MVQQKLLQSFAVSHIQPTIGHDKGKTPPFQAPETLRAAKVWEAAPLGIVGGIGAGLTSGALFAIGPVYATRVGFSSTEVAWVIGAWVNLTAGRTEQAVEMLERERAANPDTINARVPLAAIYEGEGRHDKAR